MANAAVLAKSFCEISKRITVQDRCRQRSPAVSVPASGLEYTELRKTLPHPCHHEFVRARLLKTFGSRSAKNASTRIPARNRKNAAITLGFCKPGPRRRAQCSRQHFDSTNQFTIPAQFNAAPSRQNWRAEQIKIASPDSAQIQSPSALMRHNPFMAHEFF